MTRTPFLRALPVLAGLAAVLCLVSPARAQFVDEHFAALPDAPAGAPAEAGPAAAAIAEGYALMARVTGPEDEDTIESAKQAFERALDLEPRNAHAWNGKGMVELAKDEGWLILLESFKKLFNRDHISMAIKAFEEALEIDSDYHAARYNLGLAYRQARGEENWRKAAREFRRVVDEAPGTGQAPLLLALTYRDLGDIEAMRAALEAMPEGTESLPASVRHLLLAWASFNGSEPAEGSAAYWRGVDAITADREARLFWHDIRPIVGPRDDAAFDGLDVEGKKAYLREFWQALADQSFIPVDERLAEHYRRLDHVYRHYRIDLPERRHYSTIAAYVPPWQTGFDDRGVIYLRHGPPDDEASYSGPEVERNVSWKYDRTGSDPLVFHFVSDEDVNDFKLVKQLSDAVLTNSTKMTQSTQLSNSTGIVCLQGTRDRRCDPYDQRIRAGETRDLRALYASRGHLDPLYDRAALNLDLQTLDEERSRLAQEIELATLTTSFRPPSGESLLYPVRTVTFQNPGGELAVAFYYALPAAQVQVVPAGDGRSAVDFRQQLLVEPISGGESTRAEEEVRLVARTIPREPGVLLPRVRWVELDPGQYHYGLRLTDLTSGHSGLAQGDVTVDDLRGGLALSGIVLATGVTPATGAQDPFARWGRWRVVPLPSHTFRRDQTVFVYYEAYGLATDAEGAARYRTTYTLEAGNPDRNVVARFFSAVGERLFGGEEKGSISYTFEHARSEDVSPTLEFFSLDVSGSPAGDYVLTIEIEDLVAGRTARRQTRLALVP
jgi:GWxTD domain-containing protein